MVETSDILFSNMNWKCGAWRVIGCPSVLPYAEALIQIVSPEAATNHKKKKVAGKKYGNESFVE